MGSRGYRSGARGRAKMGISGGVYSLLTVLVILLVALGVFLATRGQRDVPASAGQTPAAAADQSAQPNQPGGWTEADAPTDAPPSGGGALTIEQMLEQNPDLAPLEGDQKVNTDDLSITEGLPSDWHNVLLLGSDTRNIKRVSRTDTIIIASINVKDGRIKLISIMRDTVVPIPGHGNRKINSASYYGGPQLTMKVVNECFKMNISEYVLVNFSSFREVVDILGGIDLDITERERKATNEGLKEQARLLGLSRETWLAGGYDLKTSGDGTHMDGLQALSYARIRHLDSDYERTRRQRKVINAAIKKFRGSASITQLAQLATSMWDFIDTNVDMMSAVGLATTVLRSGIGEISSGLMPITGSYVSESRKENGAGLYDVDFAANAERLYKYIYVDP